MSAAADAAALPGRIAAQVRRAGLLPADTHVLVAASGGLDSMVLLHLLRFHLPMLRVTAAHYDHAMRAESRADADWVRGVCTAWQVPLLAARARRPPASEAAARGLRYEFLHTAAAEVSAALIATAHHADDQAETVLFRLARGTAGPGLAGIPERRGIIVRPLLPFSRMDLRAYALHARIRWREDPSNQDLRFARNRVRHLVLPALERVQPGAARRIARTAARIAESESAWNEVVAAAVDHVVTERKNGAVALAREQLLAYHPHIRARVLRHLLAQLGCRPDRAGTKAAVEFISSGASGAGIELPGGVMLAREFDRLWLRRARAQTGEGERPLLIPAPERGSGTFVAGGRKYSARWTPEPGSSGFAHAALFDPSSLRFPLELRAWRAGDRIRLAYGSKKVKKLFQERRIGRAQRARVPVLADARGDVLWVVGVTGSAAPPTFRHSAFEIMVGDGDTD